MRKVAMAFALVAGVIALGISLYLLIAQPSINGVVPKSDTDTHVAWLSGWVYDMGTGTPFRFPAAATVLGLFGVVFSGAILLGAWLITRRFVAGALLLLSLDMIALILIVICPDPRTGVYVWALPGLLLAGVGFLMGIHQEKVQEPDGYAEF